MCIDKFKVTAVMLEEKGWMLVLACVEQSHAYEWWAVQCNHKTVTPLKAGVT